ncbi:Uncharacterized oxidoreductase MXAN_5909 [Durusdinium trenchii]|uniref:Uncharacterized oxidoreductase MXAN_5909 n=1 Tax=Durusdinium trenchii TaxID=1381693 RepID=A0ABP0JFV9_9DINO
MAVRVALQIHKTGRLEGARASLLRTRRLLRAGPRRAREDRRMTQSAVGRALGMLLFLVARIGTDVFTLVLLLVVELPRALLHKVTGLQPAANKCLPPERDAEGRPKYSSVLVTGASVGIGAGLARRFAKPGTHLVLVAVNKPSLEPISKECKALGATVEPVYCDVRDTDKMAEIVRQTDAKHPLDLVIANAGVVPVANGLDESPMVFDTNARGALNTVLPCIECFRKRGRGQVVLLSSLGSFAPATNFFMLPYVATKTAIRTYAEGLRTCMMPENIGVTAICPGFVETRMTAHQAKMGLGFIGLVRNDDACDIMYQGIIDNEPEIVFPTSLHMMSRLVGSMPAFVRDLAGESLGRFDPFVDMEHRIQTKTVEMGLTEDRIDKYEESIVVKAARAGGVVAAAAACVAGAVHLR